MFWFRFYCSYFTNLYITELIYIYIYIRFTISTNLEGKLFIFTNLYNYSFKVQIFGVYVCSLSKMYRNCCHVVEHVIINLLNNILSYKSHFFVCVF